MTSLRWLALVPCFAAALGCSHAQTLLNAGARGGGASSVRPRPPTLLRTDVRLSARPTEQQLAAYYCAERVRVPALVSPCRVFGPIPTRDNLQFTFSVDLTLRNDNSIPLPTAEAMLAFTAFPQRSDSQALGALCVSLRDRDSVSDAPNGCRDTGDGIRTMADFGGAAARFLFNAATGQTRVSDVRIRTIPPGEEIHVVVSLGLDPETTLRLLGTASGTALDALQRGQQPHFEIPYALEGSLWVEVENFGRFAVSIPRNEGRFDLAAAVSAEVSGRATP
ncbi:MAG: hypothetical protein JNK72_15905 [Myxococcales bacterium]|nr:hypothetical protein [Myxococcales bacterium]